MLSKLSEGPKEHYYLRKKTKRENFIAIDNIVLSQTKIELLYISKTPYKSNDYSYIKFSFSDKINLSKLIQNKVQSLLFNIDKNEIYILDKVELGNEDESKKEHFIIPIYLKKVNTWYINLIPKIKGYFFECIFYSRLKEKLPENLIFKDILLLNSFDKYNLKYRKAMSIINAEKIFIKDYINNISLDSNSYKICVRIQENGKMLSSVHELKLEEKINTQFSKLKPNTDHISRIFNIFDEFKKNKSTLDLKIQNKDLDDDKALKHFLKKYIYAKKSYNEIPNINNDEVNLMKEYILKLVLKFIFIDIDKEESIKNKKQKYNNMCLNLIDKITQIITEIEQFANNKENSLILKYRLYRATLYNLYSIIKKNSSNNYKCLKNLSKYNQKIIDINSSSETNPYHKAIKFLENVADNLNEDSALFDLLLQYNSGISDDIKLLFKRKNKKNQENKLDCSKYELSMQTVKEVVNHLKDILPSFIIRYTANNDVYAFYSCLNDVIFLNEQKTFNNSNIIELNDTDMDMDGYTLPIVIILLHECWGHKKVLSSNNKKRDSPIRNYIKSQNFNEEQIYLIDEKTGEIKGESGLGIEFLITGVKYNNIFSKYLLSNKDENNDNLLNVKLWVQSDFKEFQQLLSKNIEELYEDDIDSLLNKNREDDDSINDRRLNSITYYEDDVEIGILYKI